MVRYFTDEHGRVRKITDGGFFGTGQSTRLHNEATLERAKESGLSKRELFEQDVFDKKISNLPNQDRDVVLTGLESGRIAPSDVVEGGFKFTDNVPVDSKTGRRILSAKKYDQIMEKIHSIDELNQNPEAKKQFIKLNALHRGKFDGITGERLI